MNKSIIALFLLALTTSSFCVEVNQVVEIKQELLQKVTAVEVASCLATAASFAIMYWVNGGAVKWDADTLYIELTPLSLCLMSIIDPDILEGTQNYNGIFDFWKNHKKCEHSVEVVADLVKDMKTDLEAKTMSPKDLVAKYKDVFVSAVKYAKGICPKK